MVLRLLTAIFKALNKTKISLQICGWSSLCMGLVFSFPHFYAQMEGANFENIAWLRNLGAALISVNGIGALLASSNPNKEESYMTLYYYHLFRNSWIILVNYNWEFSATIKEFIIIPLLAAGLVSVMLLIFRPK